MTSNVTSISSVPKLSLLVPHSLLSFRAAWNSSLFFSSVHYSCSVLSDCLWPNGLQHARPPYPSPTPGVYSNSCPLSRWCHSTISSSLTPFSSHLQSFSASGSFLMSQFFASGGQSIGVSASASVLPMNIQDWFPLGWTGWISLLSKGSQESSPTPHFENISFSILSLLYGLTHTSIHDWKCMEKSLLWLYGPLLTVMSAF